MAIRSISTRKSEEATKIGTSDSESLGRCSEIYGCIMSVNSVGKYSYTQHELCSCPLCRFQRTSFAFQNQVQEPSSHK